MLLRVAALIDLAMFAFLGSQFPWMPPDFFADDPGALSSLSIG
jgi:hypothetical protein